MAAFDGTLLTRRDSDCITVRVEGRATMAHSPAVRMFMEHCLKEGTARLQLDLGSCVYMDSTFIGTILQIQKQADRTRPATFWLAPPSQECTSLLEQMGIAELLPIQAGADRSRGSLDESGWKSLPVDRQGNLEELKKSVLEAHQELASLHGPIGEQFRQVVNTMEE